MLSGLLTVFGRIGMRVTLFLRRGEVLGIAGKVEIMRERENV